MRLLLSVFILIVLFSYGWSIPPVSPLLVILDMEELLYIHLHLIIHYTWNIHLICMIPHSILQIKASWNCMQGGLSNRRIS